MSERRESFAALGFGVTFCLAAVLCCSGTECLVQLRWSIAGPIVHRSGDHVIRSSIPALVSLGGEPAMAVVPSLRRVGILAIMQGLVSAQWAAAAWWSRSRRNAGSVAAVVPMIGMSGILHRLAASKARLAPRRGRRWL